MNRKKSTLDWYYRNREYQMQKHRESYSEMIGQRSYEDPIQRRINV